MEKQDHCLGNFKKSVNIIDRIGFEDRDSDPRKPAFKRTSDVATWSAERINKGIEPSQIPGTVHQRCANRVTSHS